MINADGSDDKADISDFRLQVICKMVMIVKIK